MVAFIVGQILVQMAKRVGIIIVLLIIYICMQKIPNDTENGDSVETLKEVAPGQKVLIQTFSYSDATYDPKLSQISIDGQVSLCKETSTNNIVEIGKCKNGSNINYSGIDGINYSKCYSKDLMNDFVLCKGSSITVNNTPIETAIDVKENDTVTVSLVKNPLSFDGNNIFNISYNGEIVSKSKDLSENLSDVLSALKGQNMSLSNNIIGAVGNKFALSPEIMQKWLYGTDYDIESGNEYKLSKDASGILPAESYWLNKNNSKIAKNKNDTGKIYTFFEDKSSLEKSIGFVDLYLKESSGKEVKINGSNLPLGVEIPINNEGSLFLKVDQSSFAQNARPVGGYYINVKRSCNFSDGQKLDLFLAKSNSNNVLWSANVGDILEQSKRADIVFERKDFGSKAYTIIVNDIETGVTVSQNEKIMLYAKVDKRSDSMPLADNSYKLRLREFIPNTIWSKSAFDFYEFVTKGLGKEFVAKIFDTWIHKTSLVMFARLLMVLYVAITGVFFVLGMSQNQQKDIIGMIMKMTFILIITSNSSFDFFHKHIYPVFVGSADDISQIMIGGNNLDSLVKSNKFNYLDKTIGYIFNPIGIRKILALLFDSPMGFIYAFILVDAIWDIFKGSMIGVIYYIQSLIFTIFLLCLSPLFCCFILFSTTKQLFDGWIRRMLINIFIPVFYSVSIVFLSDLVYVKMHDVFKFGVGQKCYFKIPATSVCLFSVPEIIGSNINMAVENESDLANSGVFGVGGINIDFSDIFLLIVACKLFEAFSRLPHDMAMSLFGSIPRMSMGFTGHDVNHRPTESFITDSIKETLGQDQESIQRRKQNRREVVKRD